MSASSATTLISPPAASTNTNTNTDTSAEAATTTTTDQPATQTSMQRSNSQHGHTHKARHAHTSHGAHHGHAHHGKRRPSAHSAHTTGHLGGGRRGSESDGGRKVAFAALTMAAMNQGEEKGKRRKSQEERPQATSSKSDTHLPRLSRTTSITSTTSSQPGTRPRLREKESENSVVVVDDDGQEVEQVDAEDEEWDDEDSPKQAKVDKNQNKDQDPMSLAMRRTMSESIAAAPTQSPEEMSVQPASITSPISAKKSLTEPPSLMTRKTTGFSGALHPAPEPEPETVEAPNLKRVQSVKELAHEAIEGERRITARKLAMMESQQRDEEEDSRPGEPTRTRSTEGSGLPVDAFRRQQIETSPSFPFPRLGDHPAGESSQMAQRSASGMAPRLRQRSSNTSLRSTASYRAPPHPLNTQPQPRTANHSRSGSAAVSPDEFDIRRSMHHPPIAPPVINTESAEGHTWDIPEDRELLRSSSSTGAGGIRPPPPISRRDSTTSQRSLRAIFQPTSGRAQASTSAGPSSSSMGQQARDSLNGHGGTTPSRRMTAIEAAAAASKLHTTNNPALYHQSLGYSPSASETAHLISRFLPTKKSTKPPWNITPEMVQDGQARLGLTDGDYRESHDSLIRQMRELNTASSSRRQDRRVSKPPMGGLHVPSVVRNGLDNSSSSSSGGGISGSMGTVKTRNGPLNVSRGGGWGGKTPFELGVERCLAQRPKSAGWG